MTEPIFWLGLSILLVAVSLTAVLVVALPTLQELARAARSAQQLFDTLTRELPPTLESIRLTGMEISDLTDDISEGVKSAGQVVKQVDQGIGEAKKRAQRVQGGTRRAFVGVKAAWKSLTRPVSRSTERLSSGQEEGLEVLEQEAKLQLTEIETETEIEVSSRVDAIDGGDRDRKQQPVPSAASQQGLASQPDSASLQEKRTSPNPADPSDRKSSNVTASQQNQPQVKGTEVDVNAKNQDILDSLIEDFSEETPEIASD